MGLVRSLTVALLCAASGLACGADRSAKLADQFAHGTPYQRSEAAQMLQRDGAAAAGAADSVLATTLAAIDARDWAIAGMGVDTLAVIKPAALAGCLPPLDRALAGGIRDVRREAARLVPSLGKAGASLAPTLVKLTSEPDCAADALRALASIDAAPDVVVPALRAAAENKDPAVAGAGIEALEHLGPGTKETIPILCGLLGRAEIRARVLAALASFGHAAADAMPQVLAAEKAAAPGDRALFVRALQQIETADLPPVAKDAQATCREGGSVELDLAIEDLDDFDTSLSAALAKPAHGEVAVRDRVHVTYHAEWGFVGKEVIPWRAKDGRTDGAESTLTIAIEADPTPAAPIGFLLTPNQAAKLRVDFDKPLEKASAETAANYAVDHGVTISAATLVDPRTVELTTSGLEVGGAYELSVHHVANRAQTPVVTDADHIAFKAQPYVAGLRAERFANTELSGEPSERRVVENATFPEGPWPKLNDYSARITGLIEVPTTDTYTFSVTSDDGVRMWIDGKPLVDAWRGQSPTEFTGTIELKAGILHDLKLEFFQGGGGQVLTLSWSTPTLAKQPVPASAFHTPP